MAGYFFFAEKDTPNVGNPETQADLSQGAEGSGRQEGELALSGEVVESGGEEAEDAHDDEGDSQLDPDDLDEDVQCPKEEETVQLPGSPECKTCRYTLVRTPKKFKKAQVYGSEAAMRDQGWRDRVGFNVLFLII